MAKDTVMLKVEVSDELRSRLKSQAVRVSKTMGELLEELIEKPLRELELENLGVKEKTPDTLKRQG